MHEFSVAQSLLSLVEECVRRQRARRVTEVIVRVGVLSGVEPELLRTAFEALKEGTVAESARLVLETERLSVRCRECSAESEKEELSVLCPACGSPNTEVIRGEDLLLVSLEMEVDEASADPA